MKIGKYEFISEAKCNDKIKALGVALNEDNNEYPTHNHGIVKLGHIVLSQGEYDAEGNETKAPILSSKYHVDVCWDLSDSLNEEGELIKAKHPHGWKTASVSLGSEGVHGFMGLKYLKNKLQNNKKQYI